MPAPKEGGFKMSFGSLKTTSRIKASVVQKETKRPRLALDDDEPDGSVKQQEIIGWDAAAGGALDLENKGEKQGPRVIPALPNRDWHSKSRQKQAAKTIDRQTQADGDDEEAKQTKTQYGLVIVKKDVMGKIEPAQGAAIEPATIEKDDLTDEQRLEKKALDALLNGKSADHDHIIPIQEEKDAFLNDVHNAPDVPTLEAYEATPIEGFGAAMLRGMGWKGDNIISSDGAAAKSQGVKRRPALLGIGAKEEAATGVELEGLKIKEKGKKAVQSYNPVALRNKHTGELISEEELKAKLENQEMIEEQEPETKRRKDDDGRRETDRRHQRRIEDKNGRDRDRVRKRDDRHDSDRRRDKYTSTKDDYHEREQRRDKRRDRSRNHDYDSERLKDRRRERSSSLDSRKAKDRNHHRSRSRDARKRRESRVSSESSCDRRKRRRGRDYESDHHRDDRRSKYRDVKHD